MPTSSSSVHRPPPPRLDQGAGQVVGRFGPPAPHQLAERLPHLRRRRDPRRLAGATVDLGGVALAEPVQLVPAGDAEQLEHHDHRQRVAEPLLQVDGRAGGQVVQQPAGDRGDAGFHRLDPLGGEPGGGDPAQPAVLGAVAVDHRVRGEHRQQRPVRRHLAPLQGGPLVGVLGQRRPDVQHGAGGLLGGGHPGPHAVRVDRDKRPDLLEQPVLLVRGGGVVEHVQGFGERVLVADLGGRFLLGRLVVSRHGGASGAGSARAGPGSR